jgi:hypothetical protein
MKKIIKASVLLLSLSTAFTMNAEPVNTMVLPDAARDKLKAIGLSIEHVEPSPVKDIFTVISREGKLREQRRRLHFYRKLIPRER